MRAHMRVCVCLCVCAHVCTGSLSTTAFPFADLDWPAGFPTRSSLTQCPLLFSVRPGTVLVKLERQSVTGAVFFCVGVVGSEKFRVGGALKDG